MEREESCGLSGKIAAAGANWTDLEVSRWLPGDLNAAAAAKSICPNRDALHLMTPPPRPTPPPSSDHPADRPPSQHWLVVGGGVMGLQVADDLLLRGQRVTLAEAAASVGGLASPWRFDHGRGGENGRENEIQWDRFYHVTLLSDTTLRDRLTRLGLEKDMRWVQTRTGFFCDGRLVSMSDTAEFLRFPPLGLIEKLRLGGTIFYASRIRNWRRLEKIAVEKWLRRWSGRGVFEKIWRPLLMAKLGAAYRKTSAAFIWAHTARMYKARRSGMKQEMFGYVPGGYAAILNAWTDDLQIRGGTIQTRRPVSRIVREDGQNGLAVTFGDGSGERFDNVITTIASPQIAEHCPGLSPAEAAAHRGIEYLGVVCASMLTRKPISPFYVTNITDTWVPLTAVIEMSTIVDPDDQLGGYHLIYLPKYLISGDEGLNESDDDYREKCLSTLEQMYDHFDRRDVVDFKVARARYVAALSTIDYSTRLPPVVTSVPGLYALNAAHIVKGNLNVNETLELGQEKFAGEVWPDFERRIGQSAC